MKCKYLLKYGWKGEVTYNRKDESKFLFMVHPSTLPLTLYQRDKEPLVVTREMIEKMDDDFIKTTDYFLNKTWITKDGLKECGGDIIASVEIEGDENWDGYTGDIEIEYICNKCKSPLKIYSDIWKSEIGHEKLLPEVITTVEELNQLLTKQIKEL